jgi:cytochrome c
VSSRKLLALIVLVLVGVTSNVSLVNSSGTDERAMRMVKKAIDLMKAKGKDAGLAQINTPNAEFNGQDIYLMVYDFDGNCLAHSASKVMVGRNLMDDQDADGREFIRETVEMMNRNTSGWHEYTYRDLPQSIRIRHKRMYIEKYQGMIMACIVNK